jgi:hypothetical protein
MTMDALDLLGRLGQVEPADRAVLEAALDRFARTAAADAVHVRFDTRARRPRRPGLITSSVGAIALATAASFAAFALSAPRTGAGDSHAASHSEPSKSSASSVRPPSSAKPEFTISAVLTAFNARRNDVLMVSKTVRGEGSCCKTTIWISPIQPVPGATVRSRILNRSLGGSWLSDMTLTYAEPAAGNPTAGADCSGIFGRPKIVWPPSPGFPGTLTVVSYLSRGWATGKVRVQAPTLPSGAGVRACLKDGQWRVTGQDQVAGSKTIELVSTDGSERLWVSAATLLPERLVSAIETPYGATTISFAFRFLPPTAASQAMLTLPAIPAGFRRFTF